MSVPGWVVASSIVLMACVAGACAGSGAGYSASQDGGDEGGADAGPDPGPTGPAIYVSTAGSDLAPGTSPSDAVQTIDAGIALASACVGAPCVVKIAEGRYQESVKLVDGVSLYGGYTVDFSVRDVTEHTAVVASSSEQPSVVATGLVAATTVDGITIEGPDLTLAGGGTPSIALSVASSGDALLISNALIVGNTGAQGVPGDAGTGTTCDASGGEGGVATDCESTPGGNGGADGDPASGGDGGGGGSSDCPSACPLVGSDGVSDGTAGAPGGDGAPGQGGTASADAMGSFATGAWTGSTGAAGLRGTNGTGGGGGGSGGTKRIRACFSCGTLLGGQGASGAPGGCAGGGGSGGGQGGASVAVLIVGSQPVFQNVTVVGGHGGTGGAGGAGAAGTSGATTLDAGLQSATQQTCGAISYSSGAGGLGGPGGSGGPGGGGAGGNGGPSLGVATLGGVGTLGQYTIKPGTGGAGGPGGTSPGLAGASGLSGATVGLQAF